VANCPSLMILWAWGVPKVMGPWGPEVKGPLFQEWSGPSALHGEKINGFPSIKICFFPPWYPLITCRI
jgi:hypothetical protein